MFNKIQTVGSISEFLAGPDLRQIKRAVKKFNKKADAQRLQASIVTLATGATAVSITSKLFSNTAYAQGTEAIPVVASPGEIIKGEALQKIVDAFMPLVEMIQALAYPIALVMLSTGAIMFMINQKERGISYIQQASLGYLLVQLVPLFMKVLVGVGGTVALGVPMI
jgi:hypothetical protein